MLKQSNDNYEGSKMKIVNLETFRSLPVNTLYSKYEPCVFEEMLIKDETIEYDFFCSSIVDALELSETVSFSSMLSEAQETGDSLDMDFDICGRDGCFEKDQLFAVYENKDVKALIEKLKTCIHDE